MDNEKIEIKKEINERLDNGRKYKIKNLNFRKDSGLLFGTIIMNKESRNFKINLKHIQNINWNESPFDFEDKYVETKFNDALLDFYLNHIKTSTIDESKKTKDENIIIEKGIIVKFK